MPHEAPTGDDPAVHYRDARVCVTGGAGFIGGWLAESLLDAGAHVCIVDDLSTGSADLAAALVDEHPERCRFVHASILDPRSLDDAMERTQIVFHLAALSSVAGSMREPERSIDVNVRGAVETAQAARAANARRLVFVSSSAIYGESPPTPTREDHPAAPVSPYGAGKLAAETIFAAWSRAFSLSTVSLRLFNVYGPRQPADADSDESAVVSAFAARLASGRPPLIFGDGEQTRDFIHVSDVVRAILLAGAHTRPFMGEVFNIGSGSRTSIASLARLIADASGRRIEPEHAAPRSGDARHSQADITLARDVLGFSPTVDLASGLRSLWANVPVARSAAG